MLHPQDRDRETFLTLNATFASTYETGRGCHRDKEAAAQSQSSKETGESAAASKVSEADKIVMDTKQKIADGSTPPLGVSASNSGRGYDAVGSEEADFIPTALDGTLEEEPSFPVPLCVA